MLPARGRSWVVVVISSSCLQATLTVAYADTLHKIHLETVFSICLSHDKQLANKILMIASRDMYWLATNNDHCCLASTTVADSSYRYIVDANTTSSIAISCRRRRTNTRSTHCPKYHFSLQAARSSRQFKNIEPK